MALSVIGGPSNIGQDTLNANHRFYQRVFLENKVSDIVPADYGMRVAVDKHRGRTAVWNRLDAPSATTSVTTEGVMKTALARTNARVEVTLAQYSENWAFSDLQLMHGVEGVFKDTSALAGKNAQLTENLVVYTALLAGTTIRRADGVASLVLIDTPASVDDLQFCIQSLRVAHAEKFSAIASGSTNVDTVTVNSAYVAICHENQKLGIEDLTGFESVEKYAASGVKLLPGEFGSYREIRFIADTDVPLISASGGAGGKAVYGIVIMGKDAFGVPFVGSKNATLTVKALGSGGATNDANDQVASVGFKMETAAIILHQNRVIVLHATLS